MCIDTCYCVLDWGYGIFVAVLVVLLNSLCTVAILDYDTYDRSASQPTVFTGKSKWCTSRKNSKSK